MSSESRQVRRNLIFNILSLGANLAVGVFYTPYLVKTLGIIAYGIIPLALIINQYISVLTGSLTSALTRFYSIALQKNDKKEASKYLSTSIIVVLAIIILLIGPLWWLVSNIEDVFTVPTEFLRDTQYLFVFTIISFFISLLSSVFNITLYAYNRLDLLNVVKIIRVSGKFIFVFILFNISATDVTNVGLANLVTEIIVLIFSIVVFYKFSAGKVEFNFRYYSKTALQAVGLLAFWVIIQQIGDTGLYRVDNILVNVFWSTKESGVLGAFTELGNYAIILASVVGSLFGPLILISYSKDDHAKVQELSIDSSLILGVLVAVMIGVLVGFAPIILKIWIGEEVVPYSNWLILKLCLVPFYASAGIYAFAARAKNMVRFPALFTVFLGILNFGILYLLAKFSGGDLEVVNLMLVVALVLGIGQSYLLNGLYFAKIYPGNTKVVLVSFAKILSVLIGVSIICNIVSVYMLEMSTLASLLIVLCLGLILLIGSVVLVLNSRQKSSLISLVKK
ncbi:MATE family efflux transporter [Myroides sp. LJL115]